MSSAVAEADAERAVERLVGMCAGLRSCAIVTADGRVLAESAPNGWGEQVPRLWEVLDAAPGPRANGVHVASEAGEVFATRSGRLTAIALSERFALGSLMFCDLRAALREIGAASRGSEGLQGLGSGH